SGTFDISGTSFITNGITTVGDVGGTPSPGTLTFIGPYLQGPSPSVLNVEIGGDPAKPGVDYDQLLVTGAGNNATLQGGILNVTGNTHVPAGSYAIKQLPAGPPFVQNSGRLIFS